MFCPTCKSEYRPGYTRCPDCNVDLVEALPELDRIEPPARGDPGDGNDLVEVHQVFGDPHAELLRSLLESEGIACVLFREGWNEAYRLTVGPMSMVRLMVPARDAERARELIDAAERGDLAEP